MADSSRPAAGLIVPADSSPSWPRRALPGLLFAALVIVLYASPLLSRRNFVGRDLLVYNLPMEKSVHDAWSRGKLPVWTPEISGGRPLLPNPNVGALYPPRVALGLFSFPVAMRLFPVAHWIIAGIGMMFLLSSLGVSPGARWIGAVTYTLSGVGVSEVFYPHIHPGMALLPWIIGTVARPSAGRGGRLLLLAVLFGLMFLAGDVFTSGIAVGACGLWILLEESGRERSGRAILLTLAVVSAILLALPQIVATALWVPETNRAILGMKLWASLFFSIHPLRLLELLFPYPLGLTWTLESTDIWAPVVFRGKAMGIFTTLYAGAFAVVAVVAFRKSRARGARFARALFAVALAVSVLPSLVPASWEKVASPLPLRNPEKFAVAFTFALALLAGLAYDSFRGAGAPRWTFIGALVFGVVAVGTTLARGPVGRSFVAAIGESSGYADRAVRRLPIALVEGALLWTVTVVALDLLRRSSGGREAAALALLTLVPIEANRKIARTLPENDVFGPTRFARMLDREDPDDRYRTIGESLYRGRAVLTSFSNPDDEYTDVARRLWIHYTPLLWGRGMVFNSDFDVGDFSRVESLRKFSAQAAGFNDSGPFFASLSLRRGIRFPDQKELPGFRRSGGDILQAWDVLDSARPSIRLVRGWREEASPLAALTSLPGLGIDDVVLETGRRGFGRSRGGSVRVLSEQPERLVVETTAPDPTWLFVLRGYWPYRGVRLDGRPIDAVPAQVGFSAIPVPSGRHRVDWREEVPGLPVSRWGPAVFVLLMAGLLLRERRRSAFG